MALGSLRAMPWRGSPCPVPRWPQFLLLRPSLPSHTELQEVLLRSGALSALLGPHPSFPEPTTAISSPVWVSLSGVHHRPGQKPHARLCCWLVCTWHPHRVRTQRCQIHSWWTREQQTHTVASSSLLSSVIDTSLPTTPHILRGHSGPSTQGVND